jgi:predicted flap endonuclease-1-like 5' DNA nuclease
MAHRKQNETVDGKKLTLQVNFNAPINGSKEKAEAEADDELPDIDPRAIEKHLPTIGEATAKDADDLTKIRGIGPWIEKRLNKIKIFTFKQIAKMTPQIEDDVNEAIKYFKGRVRRDEWVLQAQKIVGGTWDELNPLAVKVRGLVEIDGEKYERKLIEIAKNAMADGVIEQFEAEALWFCASDANKIDASERKTLLYIMKTYNVDEDATSYLQGKLRSLDARGVIKS